MMNGLLDTLHGWLLRMKTVVIKDSLEYPDGPNIVTLTHSDSITMSIDLVGQQKGEEDVSGSSKTEKEFRTSFL